MLFTTEENLISALSEGKCFKLDLRITLTSSMNLQRFKINEHLLFRPNKRRDDKIIFKAYKGAFTEAKHNEAFSCRLTPDQADESRNKTRFKNKTTLFYT